MGRLVIVALVVMGLQAAMPAARAQETEDPVKAAKEHFRKGNTAYDLARYTEAIKEFEAAYEAKPDPAILYNLAQAHRLAGNVNQALQFYRKYLGKVPKAGNRQEVEDRIKALEKASNDLQQPPNQAFSPRSGNETAPPPVQTAPAALAPPAAIAAVEPEPAPVAAVPAAPAESPQATLASQPTTVVSDGGPSSTESKPFYTRWWFWTGVAVVVGGAVATAVILSGGKTEPNCYGNPSSSCVRLP